MFSAVSGGGGSGVFCGCFWRLESGLGEFCWWLERFKRVLGAFGRWCRKRIIKQSLQDVWTWVTDESG